jgi:hypothetical protein
MSRRVSHRHALRFSAGRRFALRSAVLVALAQAGSSCAFAERQFVPDADPLPGIQLAQASTATDVDHGLWTALLRAFVRPAPDGINRVAYRDIGPADRQRLRGYIAALEQADARRLSRDAQFAYWVNLYNAATIDVVLSAYPVASIRDIGAGLFSRGPWDRLVVTVNGHALSLNDIEHRILRPYWRDPRVHYALNCASLGCPDLQNTAWTSVGLDARLDAAARAYINHPRGVAIESSDGLRLSSIYSWFREDFGGSEESVLVHLTHYATPPLRETLARNRRIVRYAYDWRLNDADAK